MQNPEIHPEVKIGHIHLRVSNLDLATTFYRDMLGFPVKVDGRAYGLAMVLLAAGDYHHHIALNTFLSKNGTPAPDGHTGLHHFALLYPNRHELTLAVQRLFHNNYPISDARDHGGTVSIYLQDPDGNGIELYYDLPYENWFDAQGHLVMKNDAFNPADLLVELTGS